MITCTRNSAAQPIKKRKIKLFNFRNLSSDKPLSTIKAIAAMVRTIDVLVYVGLKRNCASNTTNKTVTTSTEKGNEHLLKIVFAMSNQLIKWKNMRQNEYQLISGNLENTFASINPSQTCHVKL